MHSFLICFYFFVTSYHKISGLKQQIIIISISMNEEWGYDLVVSSIEPHKPEIKVPAGIHSHPEVWLGKTVPRLTRVIVTILFVVAVWLRVLASYWLSAGICPQVLKDTHCSLPHCLLHRQFTHWLLASSRPEEKFISADSCNEVSYNVN